MVAFDIESFYYGIKIIVENVFIEKVNIQIITFVIYWIGALETPFFAENQR